VIAKVRQGCDKLNYPLGVSFLSRVTLGITRRASSLEPPRLRMRGSLIRARLDAVDRFHADEQLIPSTVKSERRDNEVGAPENRIEWLKPYPDAPAQKTSITGTWIDRYRSRLDYNHH